MSTSNPVRPGCGHPHQCDASTRDAVMARSPLTRELAPGQRAELDAHLTALSWAEDAPLMLGGETPGGVFLIMSGRVRVSRDTAEGKEITVDIAAPGDVIGPLSTVPAATADSAWAMETTCALFLPAESLAEVVGRFPVVALALLRLQEQRLTQAREREIARSTRSVEQRVADVLVALAHRMGHQGADGSVLLQVRLRREDIAGLASTTVESASRAMARMKREGLIDSGREWVSLLDVPSLTAL